MKHLFLLALLTVLAVPTLFLTLSCSTKESDQDETVHVSVDQYRGKKVFYIDSYHETYENNMRARSKFEQQMVGTGIEIKYAYLDAKNIKDSLALDSIARVILVDIETWEPHCIIAADDAIQQYLIVPHLMDQEIPIVFIGVNWDASVYGYPTSFITGQIEVEVLKPLVNELKNYSNGNRVGVLTGNTITDRKNLSYYKEILGDQFVESSLVETFEEWKTEYLRLQNSVDILILRNFSGIDGWDDSEAIEHAANHSKIPSGTVSVRLQNMTLVAFPKLNEEFGEYAGTTVLSILEGNSPETMEIEKNKRSMVFLNMPLAQEMGIQFRQELIERANFVTKARKRIVYVNSYHRGYEWSDELEKGLFKALSLSQDSIETASIFSNASLELHVIRMDTKQNKGDEFLLQAAEHAKESIDKWDPDILIVSDDNAVRSIVVPYYLGTDLPIIFSGVNGDASQYGFPTHNVTGLVEIPPAQQMLKRLLEFSQGERVGVLASNSYSAQGDLNFIKDNLGITFEQEYIVSTFEEWKESYLRLQNEVDCCVLFSQVGIAGWNQDEAISFVKDNTRIPSGSTLQNTREFTLFTMARLAEEHGWWSGTKAREIIEGRNINEIEIEDSHRSRIFLNMGLASQLGVTFPVDLVMSSELVE